MIFCMIVQPKLLLYTSNETSTTLKALITSHLKGCKRCQRALAQLKKTTTSVRDFMSSDILPDPELDVRILDTIMKRSINLKD